MQNHRAFENPPPNLRYKENGTHLKTKMHGLKGVRALCSSLGEILGAEKVGEMGGRKLSLRVNRTVFSRPVDCELLFSTADSLKSRARERRLARVPWSPADGPKKTVRNIKQSPIRPPSSLPAPHP
mmetsp:Transcript_10928/g.45452  ORF Transcript_10928/g.45452 Transcript_10928/m.45452 type:complete len:126 (-) Transcript_10928:102-479(-)